jgi:DEAD/DEAH box helicase domain-containing protein
VNAPPLLVLDIETQLTADEVGGWDNIKDMRLAVAVTYNAAADVYNTYYEDDAQQLVSDLRQAGLIIGYNLHRFDYTVLRAYTDDPLQDLPTVDMLLDLYQALGWRPRLDNVASATLGERKSADGLAAVRWFRQGQLDKVVAYCKKDVEITWQVYDFGRARKYVKVLDRRWNTRQVPVPW